MNTTAAKIKEELSLRLLSGDADDRAVSGVYTGDLLSWVMSHAMPGDAWITIMSNPNVIAVASLVDVACVILCEGVVFDEKDRALAEEKGICVFSSEKSAYEICAALSKFE